MKYIFLLFTTFLFAQQTKFVDFKSVNAQLTIDNAQKTIAGKVVYDFSVLQSVDTIKMDAKNMEFSNVQINGENAIFVNTGKELQIVSHFEKGNKQLAFNYTVKPKQALYFVEIENDDVQIWTQGQGRYTSNWFPSFDDVNEKLIFNLGITYNNQYQVISNGILKEKTSKDDLFHWQYEMEKPMSFLFIDACNWQI